ncbi:MAG TPA: tryptophan synthase subunit alpha [Candidatus Dormibacteraeota bacterium]
MSGSRVPVTRFDAAFGARTDASPPGLIPYFTAGYPHRESVAGLLLAAQRAGCIAAEVGIPFSDPLADGPTIQRTGQVAIGNGMTLAIAVDQVREARARGVTIPLAVMTYINPVLSFGIEAFARAAAVAGVDGVILPDLPLDEAADTRATMHASGVAVIPLVAPTTTHERLARICSTAAGFVYCVGVTGVTGARRDIAGDALRLLDAVRLLTPVPRALGFGLSTHDHLRSLQGHAEAAVVGSALLDSIGAAPADDAEMSAERFLHTMNGSEPALSA